jgi:hypothetical protein
MLIDTLYCDKLFFKNLNYKMRDILSPNKIFDAKGNDDVNARTIIK